MPNFVGSVFVARLLIHYCFCDNTASGLTGGGGVNHWFLFYFLAKLGASL